MKKLSLLLITLFIPLLFACTADTNGEIGYITSYYRNHEATDFWDVAALCYAEKDISKYNFEPFLKAETDDADYSAVSGKIIGLKMLESRGYDISEYNLAHYIETLEALTLQDDADGYALPILQRLYGIYAIKLAEIEYPEEKIVEYGKHILNFQTADGGFSTFSDSGDIDTTAFVLPFLVYLENNDGFATPIAKATNFLRNAKNKDDTYSSFGTPNSNSTACALSALTALGYTEKDADIGDITLALATFRLGDGSYSYKLYGETNMLSCAQALIAYCDFSNGSSLWLSILNGNIKGVATTVSLTVNGPDGTIYENQVLAFTDGESVLDLFKKACQSENIAYNVKGSYIASINGIAEFDYGPQSGWIYTVNGESTSVGCASYIPQNGDNIEFKYITEYEENI